MSKKSTPFEYTFSKIVITFPSQLTKAEHELIIWLYLQIRLLPVLYGIKSKAAISLTFNLYCKAIAALFFLFHIVVLFQDIAKLDVSKTIDADDKTYWTSGC